MAANMYVNNILMLDLDSESDDELGILLLYSLSKRRQKSIWKSNYLKKRLTHGEFVLLNELPDKEFRECLRVTKNQFEYIHSLIKEDIMGKECNAQKPIGTEEKLAVCLRYLSTGDIFKTIAMSYRMGSRTVSNIVSEVCGAIWLRLQPLHMPTPTTEMWQNISAEYERKWQFYNCVGAIDGKHVTIRKPLLSGSSFFNYKKDFSVVLMAVVDANYRFTFIDIGSMGRFPDGNIFSNCSFGKRLHENRLGLPKPKPLPGQNTPAPYVFVGDEALPLHINLIRPFPKAKVTNYYCNKVFNYRLSRARQTVECAFGILSARFRVFKRPFECKLDTIDKVVMAACVLHNYLRSQKLVQISEGYDVDEDEIDVPNEHQLLPLSSTRIRCTRKAFDVRQQFTECFNSTNGSVEWQRRAVTRGQF